MRSNRTSPCLFAMVLFAILFISASFSVQGCHRNGLGPKGRHSIAMPVRAWVSNLNPPEARRAGTPFLNHFVSHLRR